MTNKMTDSEAFAMIHNGDVNGWGAIYRKYHHDKYFNLVQKDLRQGVDRSVMEEVWGDAIELLYLKIRTGAFEQQKEGNDFLLPGIIGIANLKMKNLRRKKKPDGGVPPDVAAPVDLDFLAPEDFDMLLLHLCGQHLEDPYKAILLLKYFPETAEDAGMTDKELAMKLEQLGLGKWDKAKVGVYRRRAIDEMMRYYETLSKPDVEVAVRKQEKNDYALLNFGFPTGEFWGILYNTGKKFPEHQRLDNILHYLHRKQAGSEPEVADRLRRYMPDVADFMNRIEKRQTPLSAGSLSSRLSDLLKALGNRFLKKIII